MKNFWLSWYGGGEFELHSPWWVSGTRFRDDTKTGETEEQPTICAAVRAASEDGAKALVLAAHLQAVDGGSVTVEHGMADMLLEWRFCEERPEDWSPYSGRFPKADWMPDWPPAASK